MSAGSFFQKLHIGYMLDVVKGAALRFPFAFLAAIGLTVLSVAEVHGADFMKDDVLARTLLFLGQAAVLALGAQLLGDGRKWGRGETAVVSLALLGLMAATVYVPQHLSVLHIFISAAMFLFLLFAAYAGRRVTEDTVWLFNYQSAMAVIFGGIAALVLCLGLSAILATIKYLFGVKIHSDFFADIWIIGGCFFFPVYVLASVPRDLDDQSAICAMPVGISFIANYLMVPMMLVYTGILYAYGLKIIFEWSLPKGNLAYMVTGYGSVGVITHLCVYPIRDTGTRLLRFFYRRFYVLLAGPLALLAVGIWTRISEYGLTEQRVAIVLCLVWLAVLSVWQVFKPAKAHIKHVPAVLCVMALVAAFSAQKLSVQSQYERLAAALQRAGVLQDGRAVKVTVEVDFDIRKDISSILDYLRDSRSLALVRDWAEPFSAELLKNKHSQNESAAKILYDCEGWSQRYCPERLQTDDLMQAWGMEYVNRWQSKPHNMNRHSVNLSYDYRNQNKIRRVAPYDYVVELSSYVRRENQNPYRIDLQRDGDMPAGFTHLSVTLDTEAVLTIESNTGAKAVFHLRDLVSWAREKRPASVSEEDLPRMTVLTASGDMPAELRLFSFTAGADVKPSATRTRTDGADATEEETAPAPQHDLPWHMQNLSGTLLFSLPEAQE